MWRYFAWKEAHGDAATASLLAKLFDLAPTAYCMQVQVTLELRTQRCVRNSDQFVSRTKRIYSKKTVSSGFRSD